MAGILELLDWEFKGTMTTVLTAVKEKVENMQEQMNNVSREMEILQKNQKKILKMKNTNRNEECL